MSVLVWSKITLYYYFPEVIVKEEENFTYTLYLDLVFPQPVCTLSTEDGFMGFFKFHNVSHLGFLLYHDYYLNFALNRQYCQIRIDCLIGEFENIVKNDTYCHIGNFKGGLNYEKNNDKKKTKNKCIDTLIILVILIILIIFLLILLYVIVRNRYLKLLRFNLQERAAERNNVTSKFL